MPSTNPLIDQSANGRFQRTPRLSPYETPNVPKQNIRADYSTPKSQLISTLESREQTLISLWALQYSVVWNSLVAPISAIPPVLARYKPTEDPLTHSNPPPSKCAAARPFLSVPRSILSIAGKFRITLHHHGRLRPRGRFTASTQERQ